MGIRTTLASMLGGADPQDAIRSLIEEVLASRAYATRAELDALRDQLPQTDGDLEKRITKLEKKLSMAMGAVQAASADLVALKQQAAAAENAAKQAVQQAQAAAVTAEAAADGVSSVEDQLAAAKQQAAATPAPQPAVKSPEPVVGCKVDGCTNKHRARGFCARHYQQWRRSALPGFVGPDGRIPLGDDSFATVDKSHSGKAVTINDGVAYAGSEALA